MEEKVDILLATYNGEKYLKEQINSILNHDNTCYGRTRRDVNLAISKLCHRQILRGSFATARSARNREQKELAEVKI